MAWQARLRDLVTYRGEKVVATFEYFDDIDVATVLHVEAFSFAPSWSNSDMQKAVQSRGSEVRAAKARADALTVQFPPVTTVIAIP